MVFVQEIYVHTSTFKLFKKKIFVSIYVRSKRSLEEMRPFIINCENFWCKYHLKFSFKSQFLIPYIRNTRSSKMLYSVNIINLCINHKLVFKIHILHEIGIRHNKLLKNIWQMNKIQLWYSVWKSKSIIF